MYESWRLYRRKVLATRTEGNIDGRYLDREFTPTQVTFKARNEAEAMRKANKFWQQGQFGMGSIAVRKD